jgi:hypothetical protein
VYWDGTSVLVRGPGSKASTVIECKGQGQQTHHFRNSAYLYAGVHLGKDGGKVEVTEFFNMYARCLCFTVKEVIRLLFVMGQISIEDYHHILEGSTVSVTLISCKDDLVINTMCDNDTLGYTI